MLVSDGVRSFALYLYADGLIQHSGSSYGHPALVGYDYGDGNHYFNHPDSLSENITNVESTSNINVPGMWIFRLDEEDIATGRCINQDGGT